MEQYYVSPALEILDPVLDQKEEDVTVKAFSGFEPRGRGQCEAQSFADHVEYDDSVESVLLNSAVEHRAFGIGVPNSIASALGKSPYWTKRKNAAEKHTRSSGYELTSTRFRSKDDEFTAEPSIGRRSPGSRAKLTHELYVSECRRQVAERRLRAVAQETDEWRCRCQQAECRIQQLVERARVGEEQVQQLLEETRQLAENFERDQWQLLEQSSLSFFASGYVWPHSTHMDVDVIEEVLSSDLDLDCDFEYVGPCDGLSNDYTDSEAHSEYSEMEARSSEYSEYCDGHNEDYGLNAHNDYSDLEARSDYLDLEAHSCLGDDDLDSVSCDSQYTDDFMESESCDGYNNDDCDSDNSESYDSYDDD